MKPRKDYNTEAVRLSKAIDIAVEAVGKYPIAKMSAEQNAHFIKCYLEWKEAVLNPKPEYRSLASLKYSIQDVFIYFNEMTGPDVEYFWNEVEEQQLGYERNDILAKIFERGKIRGRTEYEFAVDVIVVYRQTGKITQEEASKLGAMIGEYEKPKKKK
jgi:hypothetical protein